MNAKMRALFWEELRVSGAIAGTCTAIALACQLSFRFTGFGSQWHAVAELVLAITLGLPVLMGLLFTLNTGNSGHLAGGFSMRILRLPVDAWSTVLIVLATRLMEMLLVSGLLAGTCWLLYGQGPGPQVVIFAAGFYLLIQVLDWMRAVAAMMVWIVAAALCGSSWVILRGWSSWTDVVYLPGVVTPVFLLGFILWAVLAYGVALAFVHWTRSGERFSLFSVPSVETLLIWPARERRKPFKSALSAQIWFEMRRAGLLFPASVLVFWLAAIVILWLGASYGESAAISGGVAADSQQPGESASLTFWLLEACPYAALVLAAFGWSLRFTAWGRGAARTGRPALFAERQPVTKAMTAQARLLVDGANLGIVLAIIGVTSTLSFLCADRGLVLGIFREELSHHETSLREIAQVVAGPTLFAGLVAWVIMNPSGGAVGAFVLAVCGGILLKIEEAQLFGVSTQIELFAWGSCLSGLAILFAIAWFVRSLGTLLWKGMVSRKSFLMCLLAWVALAFALFPSGFVRMEREGPWPLLGALAISAILVLGYVSTVQSLCRRACREPLAVENPDQHRRVPPERIRRRSAMAVGAIILLTALAWMRWPAEAAWISAWRAQGLPTNVEELDAWYAPVPAERNLALRYLRIAEKRRALGEEWNAHINSLEAVPFSGARLPNAEEQPVDAACGIEEKIMVEGGAEVGRDEQIPADVWEWTKKYSDAVSSQVRQDLHEAAQSGVTESRYPIDLRQGILVELPAFGMLRSLSRQLYVEALVAAVERRPQAAVDAALDIFSIAGSLKDEPLAISQMVHVSLLGTAQRCGEDVMNRVSLSEVELERVQDGLTRVHLPEQQGLFMERAMIGEAVFTLDPVALVGAFEASDSSQVSLRDRLEFSSVETLPVHAVSQLRRLLGYDAFQRLAVLRRHSIVRDWAQSSVRSGRIQPWPRGADFWTPHLTPRAVFAALFLPSLEWAYDSEWRVRTQLNVTRTAVAVEQFRLVHGELPRHLDELVPAFMDRIPGDLFNGGRPLSYRIKDNGEYVVYSYWRNWKDDGGEEQPRNDCDFTFTVAPPKVRDRRQVAQQEAETAK